MQSQNLTNNSNPLAIHGEEIRPVVSRLDGKRKVGELLDAPQIKLPQSKESAIKKEPDSKESDRSYKVNEKVKNIYNIKKDSKPEEKKVNNEFKENIQQYIILNLYWTIFYVFKLKTKALSLI